MARCTLCGGKLNAEKRCTLCGLDNTKNDDQYKHLLNADNHKKVPLTHVHNEPSMHKYESDTSTRQKTAVRAVDYTKKAAEYTKTFAEQYSHKMNQKAKKKGPGNFGSKNSAKIVGIVVILISMVGSLFGSVFSLIEDSSIGLIEEAVPEQDTPLMDLTYDEYLNPGFYTVGEHIPEGNFNIQFDWGYEGYFEIMEYEDDVLNVVDYYSLDPEDTTEWEDIYLSEGQILFISSEMYVRLYSWDTYAPDVFYEENEDEEYYFITEKANAGVDFPAGVYDICYEPAYDNEYGSVFLGIWNQDSMQADVEKELYFHGDLGEMLVRNVPLTEGSVLVLDELEEIILIPSERVVFE